MPNSSDAFSGKYNPKRVPEQNYNRLPRPESVKVDVTQLDEIPSTSIRTGSSKKKWIIAGVTTLVVLAIGAGVATSLALTQCKSSSSTVESSSNISSINNASNTTAGLSNSTSATLSTSSNPTVSTSSVSSSTTLAAGFSASGTVAAGTTAWYGYEDVSLSCSVNLINLTIIITVQKAMNATYNGAYSTFWGGTINQAYVDTGSQIIYTWTIISGQTIYSSGSPYTAEAQFHLFGTNQPTTADTYQVTATTISGVTSTLSGHF